MAQKGIYLCGKLSLIPYFRTLARKKYPIVSRWHLHDYDEGKITQALLWDDLIRLDLSKTTDLVLYLPEKTALKGALIEIGAIWLAGGNIHIVSPLEESAIRSIIGTFYHGSRVKIWPTENLEDVLKHIVRT